MNREDDFERTLRSWLDDGAEQAPERYVWAALEDVERMPQRGAGWAPLEGLIMKLKPAAPILGVAAVVVLAIAAYQYIGNPAAPPQPSLQPSPSPQVFTSEGLAAIWQLQTLDGMEVDGSTTGYDALTTPLRPGGEIIPLTGFVEARLMHFESTETGGYTAWAALYDEVDQAKAGFDFLITEHTADDGWGMERSAIGPALGDESASLTGAAYEWDTATVHVWRKGNLILAAVGVGDADVSRLDRIVTEFDRVSTSPPISVTSLDDIALGDAHQFPGMSLDNTYRDATYVLTYPTRSESATRLVMAELDSLADGIVTEFSSADAAVVSWVAAFRTEADATRALAIYLEDFTASDGWGLELSGTSTANQPEGANFEGATLRMVPGAPADEDVRALIRIWQYQNVLLAIGGFFDYDEDLVHFIGDNMAGRARTFTGADL